MTLKEMLKRDFEVELPISGGYGRSIEEPVIIHRTPINDYVQTESMVLKCLGIGRNIEWTLISQALLENDGKKVDKIKIETRLTTDHGIKTRLENFYFDITDCFGIPASQEDFFNEKETLDKIKNRLLELKEVSDFNKRCIELLKEEKLYENEELSLGFMRVIFKDESYPLFQRMMENKRKPIMEVLSILGKELD